MALTKQQLKVAAMGLEPADRLALAEELFFSIEEADQDAIDAAWLEEIKRRDAAYQRGETTAKPVDQVIARLNVRAT